MRLIRTLVTMSFASGFAFVPTGASTSAGDQSEGTITVHQRGPDGVGVALGGCYEVWSAPAAGAESWRSSVCDWFTGARDGVVTVTGLEDGRYRMHEYEPPSAHRLTPSDIIATVVDGKAVEVSRDHELAPVLAIEAVNAAGALVPGSCWIVVNPGQTEGGWGRCDKEDGADDGVTHVIDLVPGPYEVIHEVTPWDYERVEALTPFEMLDEDTTVPITLEVLAPANVELPTIDNDPARGVTLPSSPGTWTGTNPTFGYQWERCNLQGTGCQPIAGAVGPQYTVTEADSWSTLRLAVSASNAAGAVTARSQQTRPIQGSLPPVHRGPKPWVEGDTLTGTELVAKPGDWSGRAEMTFAYRWFRCTDNGACTEVPGATGDRYRLDSADIGYKMRFQVMVTNPDGSAGLASTLSARVRRNPPKVDPAHKPSFEGQVNVGAQLRGSPGVWTGNTPIQFGFMWQRCADGVCRDIPGSFSDIYTVTTADVGYRLRFVLTALNGDGAASIVGEKTAVVKANPPKVAADQGPSIVGRSVVGTELAALPGVWSGSTPMTFEYHWARYSTAASAWMVIPGATSDRYVLTAADAGSKVAVEVRVVNAEGDVGIRSTPVRVTATG